MCVRIFRCVAPIIMRFGFTPEACQGREDTTEYAGRLQRMERLWSVLYGL